MSGTGSAAATCGCGPRGLVLVKSLIELFRKSAFGRQEERSLLQNVILHRQHISEKSLTNHSIVHTNQSMYVVRWKIDEFHRILSQVGARASERSTSEKSLQTTAASTQALVLGLGLDRCGLVNVTDYMHN